MLVFPPTTLPLYHSTTIRKKHPLLTEGKSTVVDHSTLTHLFQQILKSGIPFGYQQANCHNISHFTCLFAESKGINAAKIWAFTPSIYSPTSSRLISFTDNQKLSPTGKIDWGYHVAPVIQVKIGNSISNMVIDPVLFPKGPVSYRSWLAKLKTKRLIYLIMDPEWYLFNSSFLPSAKQEMWDYENGEPIKPNVTFPDWFSNKLVTDFFKYEEDSKQNHWLEKGLAINETASRFYQREIIPILKQPSKTELLQDYRNLVGNVFNFETVFRDRMLNYEMTLDFQQKHCLVIEKYLKSYNKALLRWQTKLEELNTQIASKMQPSTQNLLS
jgi:hypothetical protein